MANKIAIWHNPRCSKSRASLNLLKENNIEPIIVNYLKEPITESELRALLKKLSMSAKELIRKSEKIYKELDLKNEQDENKLIKAILEHPRLVERPIVIKGNKAVIGRPIENVVDLLEL